MRVVIKGLNRQVTDREEAEAAEKICRKGCNMVLQPGVTECPSCGMSRIP